MTKIYLGDKTEDTTALDDKSLSDVVPSEQNLNKQALLAKLVKDRSQAKLNHIRKLEGVRRASLSYAQQQLWLISQFDPQSSKAYHISIVFRLKGELDKGVIAEAFSKLSARHEILRTNITVDEDGTPYQYVLDPSPVKIEFQTLTYEPNVDERRSLYNQTVDEFVSLPFDLSADKLFRLKLIECESKDHALILVMHHIITDAWSMGILTKEFSFFYEKLRDARADLLPELEFQYLDYVHWERTRLSGATLNKLEDFWRAYLNNVGLLQFPTDRQRPPLQSYRGSRVTVEIPANLVQPLKMLGQQNGCTLFMTLLAVYKTLLHRHTQQSDICVGTTAANRMQTEFQSCIGFFVNTLALRTEIDSNLPFLDILKRVKETTLSAYEHQALPFVKVVEAVRPERSQSYSPIFQTMFILHNVQGSAIEIGNLGVAYEQPETGTSQFDFTLDLQERSNGTLVGGIEYSTDLFDNATICRLKNHFLRLVESILASPEKPIRSLQYITESEKQYLLLELNNTDKPYPSTSCIHELFERQVLKSPTAVAAISKNCSVTYDALNRQANQIARVLIEKNASPGSFIGICMPRSIEMVAAILGVLKSGSAYVALDPKYPASRLSAIQADANLKIILTTESIKHRNLIDNNLLLSLDSPKTKQDLISKNDDNLSSVDVSANDLAYIIYTSGSTGRPKGVMITHKNVSALYQWAKDTFTSEDLSLVVAATSICFDLSIFELIITLQLGGTALITDDILSIISDPRSEKISLINTVPSAIKALLENNAIPQNIRVVNLAGEPLRQDLVESLYQVGVPKVFDLYGPSEDTTYSTFSHRLPGARPTIGRPISNTKTYILDRHGELLPIGGIGELYIGGAGLAKGYLNLPDLTSKKFIANPFRMQQSGETEKIYSTGDLCRYRSDGCIEYLGRIDHQVKIRGFRIELGDIENAILSHEQVSDAAIIVRENNSEDKYLIGFVVCNENVDEGFLRAYLAELLPEYMVPAVICTVDALPLTPNGKVDREALAQIPVTFKSHNLYEPPRSNLEHKLVEIWSDILGRDSSQIGVNDNFFDLGGHSLLATRVAVKIQSSLACSISVRQLFENPTIALLGGWISQHVVTSEILPTLTRREKNECAASFTQERLWFLAQLEGTESSYIVPAAYSIRGEIDAEELNLAFCRMLSRHEILRTRLKLNEFGSLYQAILPQSDNSLSFFYASDGTIITDGKAVSVNEFVKSLLKKPFDLSNDDLIRAALIRVEVKKYLLVISMHHVITDGWSLSIFMKELFSFYNANIKRESFDLKPAGIQYSDFSLWQRELLQSDAFSKERQYWKIQLQNIVPLQLPPPNSKVLGNKEHGGWQSINIPAHLSKGLVEVIKGEGITLFMGVLAVYCILLHRYTQQPTICVGTPIANRLRTEFENLIGPFVNTLALRIDIGDFDTFLDVLHHVKEVTLSGFENQQLPFEKVVELVQPERVEGHSPIFQTMLVLEPYKDEVLAIPGIEVEEINVHLETSKFELTLFLKENKSGLLSGGFEYLTSAIDEEIVGRLAKSLNRLIEQIVHSPSIPVSKISVLPESDKAQIANWNSTAVNYGAERCIHEVFEERALYSPSSAALKFRYESLNYCQLNARANQLAHFLIEKRHVKSDTLVGVYLERSINLVIAILAVAKAGGAYVPIDASYPISRVQYLIEDAQLNTVITARDLASKARLPLEIAFVLDTEIEAELRQYSESNPSIEKVKLTSRNLAYVIYTSGSTGHPKGVMIEHRGLYNTVADNSLRFGIDCRSNFLHCVSFSFDAASWVLWMTFHRGACLTIEEDIGKALLDDSTFVAREGFTHFMMPPSLLAQFDPEDFKGYPVVIVGGDRSSTEFLNRWAEKVDLYNAYGPTEASICVSVAKIEASSTAHIGTPIDNTELFIVDNYGQLAPIGVAGELYIGGAGLARGYLRRPELTADKFVMNGLGAGQSNRLYKSGDLCRYLPNGNLEFLGRIDNQVKIRGFRIELGEIESSLLSFKTIKDAAVVVKENEASGKYLIAFITCHSSVDCEAIKSSLTLQLPDYMVPSDVVVLDAMPLTTNGKVDRRALSSLQVACPKQRVLVTPRSATENRLVDIWAEALSRDRSEISVCDDFFGLGGHSLLAVKVCLLIKKRLQVVVSISQFFRLKTIANLAAHLDLEQISQTDPVDNATELKMSALATIIPSNLDHGLTVGLIDGGAKSLLQIQPNGNIDSDHHVNVGCISKLFAASIAMMLVEENVIELDVPILRYVPQLTFTSAATASKLTMRHLLTHSAGIDDSTLLDKGVYESLNTTEQFIEYLSQLNCPSEPGLVFSYSSLGFYICTIVIEAVTGLPYAITLQDRILKKLNGREFLDYQFNADVPVGKLDWSEPGSVHSLKLAADSHGFRISEKLILSFLESHLCTDASKRIKLHSQESLLELHKRQFDVSYHPVITAMGLGWQHYSGDVIGHSGRSAGERDGQFLATLHHRLNRAVYLSSSKFPSVELFESIVSKSYSPNILYNISRFGDELLDEKLVLGTYCSDTVRITVSHDNGLKFSYVLTETKRVASSNGTLEQVFRGMFSFKCDHPIPYADWFIVFNWLPNRELANAIKVGKITAYRCD